MYRLNTILMCWKRNAFEVNIKLFSRYISMFVNFIVITILLCTRQTALDELYCDLCSKFLQYSISFAFYTVITTLRLIRKVFVSSWITVCLRLQYYDWESVSTNKILCGKSLYLHMFSLHCSMFNNILALLSTITFIICICLFNWPWKDILACLF